MRRALVILASGAALALAGCGFTPLYADPAVSPVLSRVAVTTPDTRTGYLLREHLEDELASDRSQPPMWRLDTEIEQSRTPLGRRIDDTATRYELVMRVRYTLTGTMASEPIAGDVTALVTYAAADQPYAGVAARQDGEDRAAAEAARLIRLELSRRLADRAGPPASP